METNFGASAPYTVGIEEEFGLVDPATLELSPVVGKVLAARDALLPDHPEGLPAGSEVASELISSCLEARSRVYENVAQLAAELPRLRRGVRSLVESCGAHLAAAGAHPFSDATAQPVTDEERYREVEQEMGWAARTQSIYGLHVHVAVPDGEHAIRATNALTRYVPLFIALSANSPFWHAQDTRLASVRVKVFGLVPRSGLPPAFSSWQAYEEYVEILVAAGSIPNYTWCWWDARPHPNLGTVELRAPDAQTSATRTVALAALAQCLVAASATDTRPPENRLFIEENKWRAARHGLDAHLYDFSARQSATARHVARSLVGELRPIARDLGCEAELEGILEMAENGTGADEQRAVLRELGSMGGLVKYLAATTA